MAAKDLAWLALQSQCNSVAGKGVEYPDGEDYSNTTLGEGYQGENYFDPLLNLGLCYQLVKTTDPAAASRYAKRGVELLAKISIPKGKTHYQDPLRDSGYGIRFFGVGMAIGYDWLYEALTPGERTQVYTSLNHWIADFERAGFGRQHPQGNYFAGYYAAKALAAIATAGDNPTASTLWDSWLTTQHYGFVVPYYTKWLKGGGWPEGWNYGPLGTINMLWPTIGALTGKNLNLITSTDKPFSFLEDQAAYLLYFLWPNQRTMDDRGALYAGDNPAGANVKVYTFLAGTLSQFNRSDAAWFQRLSREVRASNSASANPAWEELLFWDSESPEVDYTTKPLSYVATGLNQVAVRSSWSSDAVWASFSSGPYINYPGSGEQSFDQGGLAIVKGGTPFLVNPAGALLRNKIPGKADKNFGNELYADAYDTRPRTLNNVFYPGKGQLANSPSLSSPPEAPRTRLTDFEEAGTYVAWKGTELADMYPAKTATTWDREVVYLRPGIFIVHDQTTIPNPAVDQYQGFHLTYTPEEIAAPDTNSHRFAVTQNGQRLGTVTTLWPVKNKTTLRNVFNSNKVYRLEVRPNEPQGSVDWLTVFDVTTTDGQTNTLKRLIPLRGAGQGVLATVTGRAAAVLFVTHPTELVSYTVPAETTEHIVTQLIPGNRYDISTKKVGTAYEITIAPGTMVVASAAGRLHFTASADGVTLNPASSPIHPTTLPPNNPTTPSTPRTTKTVYQLKNNVRGVTFLTSSETEKNRLLGSPRIWSLTDETFQVSTGNCETNNELPVYRFSRADGGDYMYTKNVTEIALLSRWRGWKNNGSVFCATTTRSDNNLPVYRFYDLSRNIHEFTADPAIYSVRRATPGRYRYEGVAFYGFPR